MIPKYFTSIDISHKTFTVMFIPMKRFRISIQITMKKFEILLFFQRLVEEISEWCSFFFPF